MVTCTTWLPGDLDALGHHRLAVIKARAPTGTRAIEVDLYLYLTAAFDATGSRVASCLALVTHTHAHPRTHTHTHTHTHTR